MLDFYHIFKNIKCIFLLYTIILMNSCENKRVGDNVDHINSISTLIDEGDIVFRRGEGLVSQIVLAHDIGGNYSHIGLVVCDNGKLKIAHSVPGEHDDSNDFDRVKLDNVDIYFSSSYATKGAVKRIHISDEQKRKLSSKALEIVARKVPFDHHYNLEDTSELYCTEFVRHIYLTIGIDLTEGRRTNAYIPGMQGEYVMPSDIYNNEGLKLIYCF